MLRKSVLAFSVLAALAAAAAPVAVSENPALSAKSGLPPLLRVQALANAGEAELLIYGFIGASFWEEGNPAKDVVAKIDAITASTIRVRINSEGGSVPDGLAIYNALKRRSLAGTKIVVDVEGIAASIASLIACAGDEVRMYANTLMMLHGAWAYVAGNASQLREQATLLETFTAAMAESYAAKTGKSTDEILAVLNDGVDHWYTAREAVDFGLADTIPDIEAPDFADEAAAVALLDSLISNTHLFERAPAPVAAQMRDRVAARLEPAFASMSEARQSAVLAALGDEPMKQKILAAAIAAVAAPAPSATPSAPAPAATPNPNPTPEPANDSPLAMLATRNTNIRAAFAGFRDHAGAAELESACLADPALTMEQVQARLLTFAATGAAPVNSPRVTPGLDETDRVRGAGVNIILARAGVITGQAAEDARQGNPFAGMTLLGIAEHCLIRAGVNTRNMTRDQIASMVLALGQSTSDFPTLLETAMHKILLAAYQLQEFTWRRFCRVGTLSDYRPHNRYHLSSFSDLAAVTESGEYKNGVLGDGKKETISGSRKGRILEVTPELIVNDDLGTLTGAVQFLGQAAGRTIEKDVWALLAQNAGLGPTMSDGNTLFHASHNNILTPAAPSVDAFDAARVAMGSQMDPGGNDYLDISPDVWVGPLGLLGSARVINAAEFDVSVSNKFMVPNKSRGLYRDMVGSPRATAISSTAWLSFADPNVEAVLEVAFLDGVQNPTIEQETNFRTDGRSYKVSHRYGVGAVGWRGAARNAGV